MIHKSRHQHRGGPSRRRLRPGRTLRLASLLAGMAASACTSEPDTLLQIDVRVPPGLDFVTLHFTVGDGVVRTYRVAPHDASPDASGDGSVPGGEMPDASADGPRDLAGPRDAPSDGPRDVAAPSDGPRDVAAPRDAPTDAPRDVRATTDGPRDVPGGDRPPDAASAGDGATGGPDAAPPDAAAPDAAPPDAGGSLGVDMLLPRRLSGPQTVVVRALDDADCLLASQTVVVTLTPGARVVADPVDLAPAAVRDCDWRRAAGAGDGASDTGR